MARKYFCQAFVLVSLTLKGIAGCDSSTAEQTGQFPAALFTPSATILDELDLAYSLDAGTWFR